MKARLPRNESGSFWLGVVMMAVSFAIYPGYAVIALLPVPAEARVATAIAASMASWALFFAGSMVSGRRGVEYVRRWFTRDVTSLPPPPPPKEPTKPAR